MQIVILDGHTLNPGDLDWKWIEAYGSCAIYDRTTPDQLAEHIGGAEIILTNKVVISRETIQNHPALRYIGVTATGYNIVDVAAARERGIMVTNVPNYGTPAVAQMVFALLLELTHHTGHHAQTVAEGRWTKSLDFCYWEMPLVELHGRTLGIVGLGRIGQAVMRIGQAFGMEVITLKRGEPKQGVRSVELDELLHRSDVLTLHCPLTEQTRNLINATTLAKMKKTAFLINTSRGPLVNDDDLAHSLNKGIIAGAGLDVLSVEPPPPNNPLFKARNCIITPHIAWATFAARERMMRILEENLRAFINNSPKNVVS